MGIFLHHHVQNGSGADPASYPMGTRAVSLGVKRPGREADHSPPSSAEFKEWVEIYLHYPYTPPWRGAQLQHRDNFTSPYQGSSVNIVTRLRDRWPGFDSRQGIDSFCHCVQTASGSHPTSKSFDTGIFSPGEYLSEREADHSLPSSVVVKNAWSYSSTPPYVSMVWCLIKLDIICLLPSLFQLFQLQTVHWQVATSEITWRGLL
jgi:hypothetical protein